MKKGHIEIDAALCKGCYLCLAACPKGLIGKAATAGADGVYAAVALDMTQCIACGACYTVCPDCAITVYGGEA